MNSLLIVLVATFSYILASPTCNTSGGYSSLVGVSSNAPFWKGVNGSEFIEELTSDTYDQYVQRNKTVFVMIYTTWCPQAKKARDGFAGAAKELNGKVPFASINCEGNEDICKDEDHPVKGIPTFYLYKNSIWNAQYRYSWETRSFVSWVRSKM